MKLSREAAEALAAEYVLGTLRGPARKRFAALASRDATAAQAMRRWETALAPLAEAVPPVDPPARVWDTILASIAPRASAPPFWKSFGLVAGGIASVFVAFFLWTAVAPPPEPVFVSMLMGPDHTARMEVSMYKPNVLRVKMMKPWKDMPGKGLELWALPKEGKPRSIGMVKNDMSETVIRIAENDPRVQGASALAVSMEPMTGSPTGEPTGPVLCSGAIAEVRQT